MIEVKQTILEVAVLVYKMRRAPGFSTFTGASGENDEDIILCLKGNTESGEGYQLEYAGFRNECK